MNEITSLNSFIEAISFHGQPKIEIKNINDDDGCQWSVKVVVGDQRFGLKGPYLSDILLTLRGAINYHFIQKRK
jgi:hypothetical protein